MQTHTNAEKRSTGIISKYSSQLYLILTVVSIGVPITIYYLQNESRQITFSISKFNKIISLNEIETNDKILQINDKLVQNVYLYEVSIVNSGSVEITPDILEDSIDFKSNEKLFILKYQIEPSDSLVKIFSHKSNNNIFILPKLLNPNESIRLKILLGSLDEDMPISPRINCRIKRGKTVTQFNEKQDNGKRSLFFFKIPQFIESTLWWFCVINVFLFCILMFVLTFKKDKNFLFPSRIMAFLISCLFLLTVVCMAVIYFDV